MWKPFCIGLLPQFLEFQVFFTRFITDRYESVFCHDSLFQIDFCRGTCVKCSTPSIGMNVSGVERMAKECITPNLYLLTKANGSRYSIARFKRNGKRIERSLGNAETISLREAKRSPARVMVVFEETEKRLENKSLCFADAPPMALNDIAEIKQWRNEKSRLQWEQTLRDYALPLLGPLALSDITRADIPAVIKPIWFTKNETASRLRMRLGAILSWAILSWAIHHGYRTDANPAV